MLWASSDGGITLWLDLQHDLPVQLAGTEATPGSRRLPAVLIHFRWLPPTQANLAQLTGTIPPGFHRTYPRYILNPPFRWLASTTSGCTPTCDGQAADLEEKPDPGRRPQLHVADRVEHRVWQDLGRALRSVGIWKSASQGRGLTGSPSPRAAGSLCVRAKRLSIFSAAGLGGMLLTGPRDIPALPGRGR